MTLILTLLFWALWLYTFVLFGRVVIDLMSVLSRDWRPTGPILIAANLIYRLTDPPLRFINRYVPPLRLGPVALDIGFIVLFFGVSIAQWIIQRIILSL
ncbi:YggT family protein [Flaviflexus equikiangi]|uniref:YggT family protein n=1 Tax=Flaviflexus equikiangi TaxID=2758573 RepID=A0ABS2TFP9_9ACTO|nr:YggT family protein [Flaviflexus equikiangi]MBM9433162.1 YggT family protein [Flaviflexus equikiangi]